MRLSGQDLRAGMAGAEIAELHAALARLGFTIPDGERRHSVFGAATAHAVATFQRAHGLPENGVVDGGTAAAMTRKISEAEEATVMLRLDPPLPRPNSMAPTTSAARHSTSVGRRTPPARSATSKTLPATRKRTPPSQNGGNDWSAMRSAKYVEPQTR